MFHLHELRVWPALIDEGLVVGPWGPPLERKRLGPVPEGFVRVPG